jgi:hypothetical protein
LSSETFAEQARMSPTTFTRQRQLPLSRLIALLLNTPRAGLLPELDAFFDHALGSDQLCAPTKSALC